MHKSWAQLAASRVQPCTASNTHWPFSRNRIVYFPRSLSRFSLAKTHPACTKPDLGSKHIPRHCCPFAARRVCGLGALPCERLSVSGPQRAALSASSPPTPHFLPWFIPLDLQTHRGAGCESAQRWPGCSAWSLTSLCSSGSWVHASLLCAGSCALQFLSSVVSEMCKKRLIESNYNLGCMSAAASDTFFSILYFTYLNSVYVRRCVQCTKAQSLEFHKGKL